MVEVVQGDQFGTAVGLMYIFNLIVGTGALTMPAAFQQAGWLVSLILVILLAFASYLAETFVTESMAAANGVLELEDRALLIAPTPEPDVQHHLQDASGDERSPLLQAGANNYYNDVVDNHDGDDNDDDDDDEEDEDDEADLLLAGRGNQSLFEIKRKVEMGKMAEMFFSKLGKVLFYLCIIIYLYGDLSIYVAAVPKSIRDTACVWRPVNQSCNGSLSDDLLCWESSSITRGTAYRIFVACFIVILGPFVFFNVGKTKYLQIATSLARWIAFGIMITLAVIRLAENKGEGHPPVGDISGVPNLFGVCVYSFMCHHSLPSLITPIRNKSKIHTVLAADYILILVFYALLSFTGIFTFSSIKDLYTLNFLPDLCGDNAVTNVKFFQYFLALFPVFTLSTNFPIISITLRNNLQTLFLRSDQHYEPYVYYLFPLLAVIPPTIVGMATSEVELLVGITGSYAGSGIQYIVPACLVYYARKHQTTQGHANPHRSPFSHVGWVIAILVWAVLCIAFVTVNHIITRK